MSVLSGVVLASLLLVAGNVEHPAVHDREAPSQGLRSMIYIQHYYYYAYTIRTYKRICA